MSDPRGWADFVLAKSEAALESGEKMLEALRLRSDAAGCEEENKFVVASLPTLAKMEAALRGVYIIKPEDGDRAKGLADRIRAMADEIRWRLVD